MKTNLPVTKVEHIVKDDKFIVSETNLKGAITSTNQYFVDISGFTRDELSNKNHNLVRHPDMPPEAFEDLWKNLKSNTPWMGIVKNRCKNGDYYWVDAYVAPLYENGAATGYQSVRVKPTRERVERAEKIYKQIREGKNPFKWSLSALSFGTKLWLGLNTVLISIFVATAWITGAFSIASVIGLVTNAILSAWFIGWMNRPLRNLTQKCEKIVDNEIMRSVYTGRRDEFGALEAGLVMLEGTLSAVIARVTQYDKTLVKSCDETMSNSNKTEQIVENQQSSIKEISSAVGQLKIAVEDIARNAANAAHSSEDAEKEADKSRIDVDNSVTTINELASIVSNAVNVINELETASQDIGSVLDVIREIAEQTNLLALNAAIEAARAGEQGRGFAVVADEVRTLASRTQQSTSEIQQMIERLQKSANEATTTMKQGSQQTQQAVEQAKHTSESLRTIIEKVQNINEMNSMIATATEEQSSVANEVDHNVQKIKVTSEEAADQAEHLAQLSTDLSELSSRLSELVSHSAIKVMRS